VLRRVPVGRYELIPGDPAGTAIVPRASQDEPRALAQAIARARKEQSPPPAGAALLEGAVQDASDVTSKVEHAVSLFTEIAQGRLDPASISDEVDALLDVLGRLDHEGRWEEALRLARSLASLLALLGRWLELLRSLQTAVSAAEQLADAGGKAWALHELGTLHLAADRHADADRMLGQAHDLREQIGDRRGLAITDRNLQVLCRALRAQLHPPPRPGALERILRKPAAALVLAMLLLVIGGIAGAVIRGSGKARASTTVSVSGATGTQTVPTRPKTSSGRQPTKPTTSGTPHSPPAITSADGTTFQQEKEGSFTVTATGTPSPTLTETGTLPEGVTFNAGVLSGKPTATGVYPIAFHAANGVSPDSAQSFTLTVGSAPAITSANTTFLKEAESSFTVTATGTPSPTLTETGTLPEGVTFNAGVLSGKPTQGGVYPIVLTAANGVGSDAVQKFTLTVETLR